MLNSSVLTFEVSVSRYARTSVDQHDYLERAVASVGPAKLISVVGPVVSVVHGRRRSSDPLDAADQLTVRPRELLLHDVETRIYNRLCAVRSRLGSYA